MILPSGAGTGCKCGTAWRDFSGTEGKRSCKHQSGNRCTLCTTDYRGTGYARRKGLDIPVVYNSSGYEKTETLKLLEGYVDIYLPDLKYLDPELAQKFSNAPDYVQAAKAAIGEMVRQTGKCEFGEDGYIRTGTIVRHLILPGHTGNSIKALRYLHETYGEDIYISIMNQYTPVRKFVEFKELNRKVTKREYEKFWMLLWIWDSEWIYPGRRNCFRKLYSGFRL